jgi:D-sedoheptulose 7-phosphate isomerase
MKAGVPFREHLQELGETVEKCLALLPSLEHAAGDLCRCLRNGNKVFACGNGGSACDAMHLVEELVGKYSRPRRGLPAICLNADPSVLTCIANDWDYQAVFARQVEALGARGDFLVIFSSSGNSENLVRALQVAKAEGLHTLSMLGRGGGRAKGLAEHELIVPSDNTARIQEMHTWFLHELLEAVEHEMFPAEPKETEE